MHYAPFLRDGKWWYGMVRGGRPVWKVGYCAGGPRQSGDDGCGGHDLREGAVQCAREWLIGKCREVAFSTETGTQGQEICLGPHRMKFLQTLLLRRCGRQPRTWERVTMGRILWRILLIFLPAVTTEGYASQILRSRSFPLCPRHRSEAWLRALFPKDPAKVLDLI